MKKTSKVLAIGLCITGSFVVSTSLHSMESFLSRFPSFMQTSKRIEFKGLIDSLHGKISKWKEIDGQEEKDSAKCVSLLKRWGGRSFWEKYSSACDKHDISRLQLEQSIEDVSCELCSIGQKIAQEQDQKALIQSLKKCRRSVLYRLVKFMHSELPFKKCYRQHESELLKGIKKGCPLNGGRKAYMAFLELMGAPQGILDQKEFSKSCEEDF